ncbi:hypothetical protein M0R45_025887 [Rubus argutus]|uniref:Uncharacterized protein n=1 Tax=Rubus argutus TaxID=59490 RepID=A0AAW1WWL0_RUBAR
MPEESTPDRARVLAEDWWRCDCESAAATWVDHGSSKGGAATQGQRIRLVAAELGGGFDLGGDFAATARRGCGELGTMRTTAARAHGRDELESMAAENRRRGWVRGRSAAEQRLAEEMAASMV